ncbi:MAG: immune inhibitor A [Armatimonadota bacterium]|nr:immune inhibitor A [Armatimonadota bacterium]MCX7777730.1 immune inhibitor A [Armatimonadota bacterium]MDW8025855.1 immune inhibitor A [Armatimonadota bacterium]
MKHLGVKWVCRVFAIGLLLSLIGLNVASGQQIKVRRMSGIRCLKRQILEAVAKRYGIELSPLSAKPKQRGERVRQALDVHYAFFGTLGTGLLPRGGLIGTIRALHLLVRPRSYDVVPAEEHTVAHFNRLLFDMANPSSLARFYYESSYGKLTITGDTYGWIVIDVPTDTVGNVTFMPDAAIGGDVIIQETIRVVDPFVDFSRYDSDKDGRVDLLFVTFACDEDARCPDGNFNDDPSFGAFHRSIVWERLMGTPSQPFQTRDNVTVESFILIHEATADVGTYAHEMGHAFGLVDLYDAITPKAVSPGLWALMCAGDRFVPAEYNPLRPIGLPGEHDPWSKMLFRWITPIDVVGDAGVVEIPPYEIKPVVYRVWAFGSTAQNEYFLLCNRQLMGFDQYLPGAGLTIWHIDKTITGDYTKYLQNEIQVNINPLTGLIDYMRKGVHMVQADGRDDIDLSQVDFDPLAFNCSTYGFLGWLQGNHGDAGDPYPGLTNNTEFTFLSKPSSATYFGLDSGVSITEIRMIGTSIYARVSVLTKPEIYIVEPKEGEILFTFTPIIRARFAGPYPSPYQGKTNIDPSSIVVTIDGQEVLRGATTEFDPTTQSLELKLTQPLQQGSHTLEIRAANYGGVQAEPKSVTFTVVPKVLSTGLQMVSIPYELISGRDSPSYVFGATINRRLARYGLKPTARPPYIAGDVGDYDYHYYEEGYYDEFVSTLVAGRSYWVRVALPTPLQIEGHTIDRQQPFIMRNEKSWDAIREADIGWQQIGNPFPFAIDLNAIQVLADDTSQLLNFNDAAERGYILPILYRWDGQQYVAMTPPEIVLEPFEGYWVRKFKPCRLVILPSIAMRSRAGDANRQGGGKRPSRHDGGWRLRLISETPAGDAVPQNVVLAVDADANVGVEFGRDMPAPPAPPGAKMRISLIPTDEVNEAKKLPLLVDCRPAASGRIVWDVDLQPLSSCRTVRLRWDGIGSIPSGWRLWLYEPSRNSPLNMRAVSACDIALSSSGSTKVRIVAERASSSGLRVSSISAVPTRGGDVLIRFELTKEARCEVSILTLAGRVIRKLNLSGARAGLNYVRWDARDSNGQKVASSVFICKVVASDDETKTSFQGVGLIRLR